MVHHDDMTRTHSVFTLALILSLLPVGLACKSTAESPHLAKTAADATPAAPAGTTVAGARNPWHGVARGVAWDANWDDRSGWYGTDRAVQGLDRMKGIGVNWIAVTPFSYQANVHKPSIRFRDGWRDSLDVDVKNAHARGIKVMVKPHIWSNQFWDGSNHWRGTIQMQSDAHWAEWFSHYERWIVGEAKVAQRLRADAFCVGLEYLESSRAHAPRWRNVIRAIRAVYDGPLTYAAHESELDLPFWDALDFIGVNAYFSLTDSNNPTAAEMEARWTQRGEGLAALSRRHDRPVVFTEVGFASIDGTARAPFRWPKPSDTEDMNEQAAAYRSLFAVAPQWDWFGGMFIWKFKISVPDGNPSERHYVFQDKPAETVIAKGFRRRFARDSPR
jgi:hypothetical protein